MAKRCYYCSPYTAAVFNTSGIITSCKSTSLNCTLAGPKDAYCTRCNGAQCLRCKPGFGLSSTGKCANLTTLSVCRSASRNSECAACNPDATCSRCSSISKLVLPVNAMYLDAGYPETQCNTTAGARAEALNVVGTIPTPPSNCSELDSDFNCAACRPGLGPVPASNTSTVIRTCSAVRSGKYPSGCLTSLPWMGYCLKASSGAAACTTDGKKCLTGRCTGSRSLDGSGLCSLNCKGLFGIYCKSCTASACTALDPAWMGRRRRR